VNYAYVDEDLFDFLQAAEYRESLLAVLVGRWFPGRLAEVKKISQTDDFQDPPGYFREAYEKDHEQAGRRLVSTGWIHAQGFGALRCKVCEVAGRSRQWQSRTA